MLEKVVKIIREVLELDDDIEINGQTEIEDIDEWDSFGQIAILSELERALEIRFSAEEILEIDSVKAIVDILERKGA